MKNKLIILVILTLSSLILYGQKEYTLSSETKKFYCTEWLFEYPDSLIVYTEYDSIPALTKYSEIIKNEFNYYDLLCWTGEVSLETPTQFRERLKIKFKENNVVFKLAKIKTNYIIYYKRGQTILIKELP